MQEHRSKSVEELTLLSNRGYEDIMEFAKSAAGSAGGGAAAGTAGHPVEATMWSLLADGADQRLVGNQFKQQLQDMMQAKMEQLDSDHKREADAADATTRQRSVSASSSGSMPDPLRLSGRDSLRGSGTAVTLASAGSGLLVSFKGTLSEPGVGVARDDAGEAGGATDGAAGGGGMDGTNKHVGYLWKRGAVNRSWKKRWCELKPPAYGSAAGSGQLLYYTAVNDVRPRGVINLAECTYEQNWSAANRKHTFKLLGNHRDGTKTAYLLAADSAEEKIQWLELMQA